MLWSRGPENIPGKIVTISYRLSVHQPFYRPNDHHAPRQINPQDESPDGGQEPLPGIPPNHVQVVSSRWPDVHDLAEPLPRLRLDRQAEDVVMIIRRLRQRRGCRPRNADLDGPARPPRPPAPIKEPLDVKRFSEPS